MKNPRMCQCGPMPNVMAAAKFGWRWRPLLECRAVTRQHAKPVETRHRASTSMYSLTFCIRIMLPERHQSPVEARSPDCRSNLENAPLRRLVSHRQASHGHFPYTKRNFENAPVTRQLPASSAHSRRRPRPDGRSHYVVISRDGRKLVTKVLVMLP